MNERTKNKNECTNLLRRCGTKVTGLSSKGRGPDPYSTKQKVSDRSSPSGVDDKAVTYDACMVSGERERANVVLRRSCRLNS